MEIFNVFGTMALKGGDKINNTMKELGGNLTNVGGKMIGFGTKLTAGVTIPIAALITQGIRYNSTVEDLETSFSVLLGSEEDAIELTNKLKKVGAETPFEITGLASATKTLLAFGVEQENLIPTMTRLGDVSLGNNEAFQAMSRVMGQINALGKLQGGDLNQLINWGWNPLNEITKKTGETMEEVRKRMSAGKVTYDEVADALESATSKGGRFYEGMAKGSQTLSGRLSTLSDVFNDFLGKTTMPLFNFIQNKAVPYLTNLIEKIDKLDPAIKYVAFGFTALSLVIGPFIIIIGVAVTAVGTFIGAITAIGSPIIIVTGLITGLITLIGGIGGAVVAMAIKSGKIKEVKESFEKFKEAVTPIPKLIFAIFTNDHDAMMELLITKFNLSREETFKFIEKVQELKEKFDEVAEKIGTKVKNKLEELFNKIYDNRHEIAQFIREIIDFGIELLDWVDENGAAIASFAGDVVEDLGEIVDIWKKIIGAAEKAIELFQRYKYWSDQVNKEGSPLSIFALPGGKHADGTNFAPGGLSLVGEKGPELLNIPRGSQIFSTPETRRILNQSSVNNTNVNSNNTTLIEKVVINAKEIKELNDLIKMFSKENIQLELNSM